MDTNKIVFPNEIVAHWFFFSDVSTTALARLVCKLWKELVDNFPHWTSYYGIRGSKSITPFRAFLNIRQNLQAGSFPCSSVCRVPNNELVRLVSSQAHPQFLRLFRADRKKAIGDESDGLPNLHWDSCPLDKVPEDKKWLSRDATSRVEEHFIGTATDFYALSCEPAKKALWVLEMIHEKMLYTNYHYKAFRFLDAEGHVIIETTQIYFPENDREHTYGKPYAYFEWQGSRGIAVIDGPRQDFAMAIVNFYIESDAGWICKANIPLLGATNQVLRLTSIQQGGKWWLIQMEQQIPFGKFRYKKGELYFLSIDDFLNGNSLSIDDFLNNDGPFQPIKRFDRPLSIDRCSHDREVPGGISDVQSLSLNGVPYLAILGRHRIHGQPYEVLVLYPPNWLLDSALPTWQIELPYASIPPKITILPLQEGYLLTVQQGGLRNDDNGIAQSLWKLHPDGSVSRLTPIENIRHSACDVEEEELNIEDFCSGPTHASLGAVLGKEALETYYWEARSSEIKKIDLLTARDLGNGKLTFNSAFWKQLNSKVQPRPGIFDSFQPVDSTIGQGGASAADLGSGLGTRQGFRK